MKKIIIFTFVLAIMANEAMAFNEFGHRAIACLADKYMTDKAKSEVQAILKTSMEKECVWLNSLRKKPEFAHSKSWHFFQLDANVKSVTNDENDGIVQLEKAISVLRNRKNESDSLVHASLRTVIHLVSDMHCLSHIHIEGIEASKGFKFYTWNEIEGKGSKTWNSNWYAIWEKNYFSRYTIFTPQYYSEDIDIYANPMKEAYEKGTPRFWAANVGEDVVRALEDFKPGKTILSQMYHTYEFNQTKTMAKAGYRLAALLNDIFK